MEDLDRPLRIALFSDSALPILNGVSVSIDGMMQELRRQGHSVGLFTSGRRWHRDSDPNIYRFLATKTPWTPDYPLAFPPFYPLVRRFRKFNPDVVHTHTPWTLGLVGMRWAQSHHLPLVTTYHTHYDKYSHYIPFLPKSYTRYRIAKHTNYYYNAADHVITPSEASLSWLQRHSVRKPVTVIPTGTFPTNILDRADLRRKLQIQPHTKVLLYVGRVAQEKNLKMLFEAVMQIIKREPHTLLLVVGDGPYRDASADIVRDLGIADRVKFIGFVPRHEVDQYYVMSDLFIFSSTTETQGLVVNEAMSYGLPAVVVEGGGASSSIEHGVSGFIVGNRSELLAEAAIQVLNDEILYAKFSQKSRETSQNYDITAMTREIVSVYQSVLKCNERIRHPHHQLALR